MIVSNLNISQLGIEARKAMRVRNWGAVQYCAKQILALEPQSPEGNFLLGLVYKAKKQPEDAVKYFESAYSIDGRRYDAAVELSSQYLISKRYKDAYYLLIDQVEKLDNSPLYLDMAGTNFVELGLPETAIELYKKAVALQPNVDLFLANLAACLVYLGDIDTAEKIYKKLLSRFPKHQRNHYHLSRLRKAKDRTHIAQMESVLVNENLPPEKNIFLYFAIGKESEDIGDYEEALKYYQLGGGAIKRSSNYDVANDVNFLEAIQSTCTKEFMASPISSENAFGDCTPIFIVGFPRTGSTLIERILSSHKDVEAIGETQHVENILRILSGIEVKGRMSDSMIESLTPERLAGFSEMYRDSIGYLLSGKKYFIEKLPFNFQYIGFIAKAIPNAKFIYTDRHPMDCCLAMYKQLFTWAYMYSYDFNDLADYFIAHQSLKKHWENVLGTEKLITVKYESFVESVEEQTATLLEKLGLPFDEQCLNFENNQRASMTASSVQVRNKVHNQSVGLWKKFMPNLQPLADALGDKGVKID